MRPKSQVVLIDFPFIDNTSSKVRPALVLFSEYGNIILAAITSNKSIRIKLTKADGYCMIAQLVKHHFTYKKK